MSVKFDHSFENFHSVNRYLAKSALSEKLAMASGAKIASESISNIRTVASLSKKISKSS